MKKIYIIAIILSLLVSCSYRSGRVLHKIDVHKYISVKSPTGGYRGTCRDDMTIFVDSTYKELLDSAEYYEDYQEILKDLEDSFLIIVDESSYYALYDSLMDNHSYYGRDTDEQVLAYVDFWVPEYNRDALYLWEPITYYLYLDWGIDTLLIGYFEKIVIDSTQQEKLRKFFSHECLD
jgi:hypothetical protein